MHSLGIQGFWEIMKERIDREIKELKLDGIQKHMVE